MMFSKSTTLAVLALLATVVEAAPVNHGHMLPVARAQLVRRGAKKCAVAASAVPTTTTSEAVTTTLVVPAEAPASSTWSEAATTTSEAVTTTSEAATTTSAEEAASSSAAPSPAAEPAADAAHDESNNENIGGNLAAAPTPANGGKKGQDQPQQDQPEEKKPEEKKPEEKKPEEQKPQEDKPQEQKPQEDKPQNSGSGGYNIQGKASFYSVVNPEENHGYSGAVACSGQKYTDADWIAAVGDAHYQGGANCGKKVEIRDKKTGNVQQVTIVDRCAGCEYGHIDLTPPVWNALHNNQDHDGIFDAEWKFL
ncbi:hypothetical protein Q8F55_002722 [Vanrija albida]|uniref:Barwin domain-containing protein n=1 Tax=Vanrija albida TaxID=181172 RepID=A0ABR3QAT1_9TREE